MSWATSIFIILFPCAPYPKPSIPNARPPNPLCEFQLLSGEPGLRQGGTVPLSGPEHPKPYLAPCEAFSGQGCALCCLGSGSRGDYGNPCFFFAVRSLLLLGRLKTSQADG